ncbi:MAG TPA: PGPGW domain-containing protein [Kofleriaceae bacterium]|nr:PGPGW domain-containing protein [Kofleriaceae bacterium]
MQATRISRAEPVRGRHSEAKRGDDGSDRSLGQLIKREWKLLRKDPPGERFRNHHRRLHEPGYKLLRVLALLFGPLLAVGGLVMLFIPGPGLLFIVFGLALLAGQSRRLAGWLDRAEPRVRRVLGRARDRWQRLRPRP